MRVLMLYIEPAPYILDLIRELRRRHPDLELRVLFVMANASQPWGSVLEDGQELLPTGRWSALRRLFTVIHKGEFDWLHLAGWGHPLLLSVLLMSSMFGQRISLESDTQLAFDRRGWKEWIKALIYPRLFSLPHLLLPGGSRQMHFFRHYGVPESKIRIAQMTVDVASIMRHVREHEGHRDGIRCRWDLPSTGTLFLYVGRLNEFKGGIRELLAAFSRMKEKEDNYLVIAGDGELKPMVEAASATLDHIRYLGRVEPGQVWDAYVASDVLLLPSRFDNWGLVVNEAMAAGLPVIASDRVGCVDDLVIDRETGRVVPFGDVNALTAAMQEMATDAGLRQRLGSNAQQRIRQWDLQAESKIIYQGWLDAGI